MADAVNAWVEDHSHGTEVRDFLCVVAGAARHRLGGQAELFCNLVDHGAHPRIGGRGWRGIGLFEFEFCSGRFFNQLHFSLDLFEEHLHFRGVQIAQPQTRRHFAGNDIVCSGKGLNLAYGADLTAWDAVDDAVDGFDVFRGGQQCIATPVHRGRSRVMGKSFDRDIPPVDADDAFDDTDVDLLAVEDAALFDMQFDISGEIAFFANDAREFLRIAADEFDAVANRLFTVGDQVELFLRQPPGDRAAADGAAFFVL